MFEDQDFEVIFLPFLTPEQGKNIFLKSFFDAKNCKKVFNFYRE